MESKKEKQNTFIRNEAEFNGHRSMLDVPIEFVSKFKKKKL